MGGVAALLWTAKHPKAVVALVVDSAFASLDLLIQVSASAGLGCEQGCGNGLESVTFYSPWEREGERERERESKRGVAPTS
jgi:pimeloyl-ACP methyl ester carboxylesterase